MGLLSATPYLFLNGKGNEAIALYQSALGFSLQSLQRFGDVQEGCPDALKDRIMHAVLQKGEALIFLGDGALAEGDPITNVHVALNYDDEESARKAFDALSEGGTVREALFRAPWGALFGAVRDKFGIHWMFNVGP